MRTTNTMSSSPRRSRGFFATFAPAVTVFAIAGIAHRARAGNTTCKNPGVTWYNNADGLNPCEQYQALRQICDTGYQTPVMKPDTPPDYCNSQLSACCCNSVAFSLSMLCLQCQQGVGTGTPGDNGIDAGAGAYQLFLGGCGAGTNKSLPASVQLAVCNTGLKLLSFEYNPFWGTGDWFLEYTRQTADLEIAEGKTDPGMCTTTTTSTSSTPTSTTTSSSSSTPQPDSTTSSPKTTPTTPGGNGGGGNSTNLGAVIGGCLAGLAVVLFLLALVIWMWRRRQREDAGPHDGYSTAGSGSGYATAEHARWASTGSASDHYPSISGAGALAPSVWPASSHTPSHVHSRTHTFTESHVPSGVSLSDVSSPITPYYGSRPRVDLTSSPFVPAPVVAPASSGSYSGKRGEAAGRAPSAAPVRRTHSVATTRPPEYPFDELDPEPGMPSAPEMRQSVVAPTESSGYEPWTAGDGLEVLEDPTRRWVHSQTPEGR